MANIAWSSETQLVIWVRLVKIARAANRDYGELSGVLIAWRQALASFRSRKGDRVIGSDELSGRAGLFIGGQTRRDIDGNFLRERKAAVDHPDGIERLTLRRPGEAGTQDGINHERGEIGVAWQRAHDPAAAYIVHAPVRGRVPGQSFGIKELHDGKLAAELPRE